MRGADPATLPRWGCLKADDDVLIRLSVQPIEGRTVFRIHMSLYIERQGGESDDPSRSVSERGGRVTSAVDTGRSHMESPAQNEAKKLKLCQGFGSARVCSIPRGRAERESVCVLLK